MRFHPSPGAGAAGLLLAATSIACGGAHNGAKAPPPVAAARAAQTPEPGERGGQPTTQNAPTTERGAQGDTGEAEDAVLVVSREVVTRCPTVRLVRAHVQEFDPDMVWLAVLEAVADCMAEGGPMADGRIGVSGDETHRRIVREVLGTRGVAPGRILAAPIRTAAPGAAECQGAGCDTRVEITFMP